MPLRFTTTDPAPPGQQEQVLLAARMLMSQIRVSSQELEDLESGDPHRVAAAFGRWRRRQHLIARREDALLLELHEAGASDRGLAELMGLNRQTITRRLDRARDEREVAR
ncbi:hypothetical protein ACNQR7_07785 [Mycolicibacterium senegalense]|uniref:hypothetical protein n=1 Tax=Mycobacteriaceae TaxID=1762 RepID=UPI00092C24C5|nr:hypothetical protein [Mycobacteroides abscessus]MBN7296644.1 hypothetical protein [Mycobacteroides abscessus subsp. abscessus]SHR97519.1 chromosome partitioning protein [Mycobacteroides abscessus subsp. abscessus]